MFCLRNEENNFQLSTLICRLVFGMPSDGRFIAISIITEELHGQARIWKNFAHRGPPLGQNLLKRTLIFYVHICTGFNNIQNLGEMYGHLFSTWSSCKHMYGPDLDPNSVQWLSKVVIGKEGVKQ